MSPGPLPSTRLREATDDELLATLEREARRVVTERDALREALERIANGRCHGKDELWCAQAAREALAAAPEPEWEYRAMLEAHGIHVPTGYLWASEAAARRDLGQREGLIERRVKAGPWKRMESDPDGTDERPWIATQSMMDAEAER